MGLMAKVIGISDVPAPQPLDWRGSTAVARDDSERLADIARPENGRRESLFVPVCELTVPDQRLGIAMECLLCQEDFDHRPALSGSEPGFGTNRGTYTAAG
jgi:hypothetical protein